MFYRQFKSAVGSLGRFVNLQQFSPSARKMGDWQAEKAKYLALSFEEKRKPGKKTTKWEDIYTWKLYSQKESLAPVIPLKDNVQIDKAKNDLLASKISIFSGDITTLEVDAIVNAANRKLLGGGGVDGAIHRAAGSKLLEECKTLNGCETGQAKITGGYQLPAKYVIHTVGPVGEKPGLLQQCYRNSLGIMLEKKLRTIAFPCISTGVYGYPIEAAAHVAAKEVRKHLEAHAEDVDRIIFCIFLPEDEKVYQGILQSYFSVN